MARVSVPIQISQEEISRLNSILAQADKDLSERISIVLACATETSNKRVAEQLNINEHTVAKWKKAYQTKGIDGLISEHGGGRKANNAVPGLEGIIKELINKSEEQEEDEHWSIKALAEKTGASEYQVSSVLKECGISLQREHRWSYETAESCESADVEVVGIYLSPAESVLIACYCQYGIKTASGVMNIYARDMANRLTRSGQKLTRDSAIAETGYYSGSADTDISSFVEDYISSAVTTANREIKNISYGVFVYSDNGLKCKKPLPEYVSVSCQSDRKKWLSEINSWIGQRTSAAKHYEIEQLSETMNTYLELCKKNKAQLPFLWQKKITETGSEQQPFRYKVCIPETEETATVKESDLKELLGEIEQKTVSDKEIQTGFIVFTRGKSGLEYRTVIRNEGLPSADEFGFDTEEAFLKGMNALEQKIIRMRDEAGLAATDLYIEQVKKNKRP